MRAWLRRNLVALIVLAVAAPLAVFVLSGIELLDRAQRETVAVVADAGGAAEVAGVTAQVTDSGEFEGLGEDENRVPVGLALVATLTEVEAKVDASCDAVLVAGSGETKRSWPSLSSPERFGYGVGDETETLCSVDAGGTIVLESVFLTPVGLYPDVSLELTVRTDEGASLLRLPLS
jgi:hypothetical protein